MSLFEFEVRRQLAQEGGQLSGIYAATPKPSPIAQPQNECSRMSDHIKEWRLNKVPKSVSAGHQRLKE